MREFRGQHIQAPVNSRFRAHKAGKILPLRGLKFFRHPYARIFAEFSGAPCMNIH
jgi:hypothetical protein